jgi:hypothetical protein
MNYDYQDFEIEPFELGRGRWHARFGRADKQAIVIDGVMLSTLNVGLAWPNPDAAVDDAKAAIDRLRKNMVASGLCPPQSNPARQSSNITSRSSAFSATTRESA